MIWRLGSTIFKKEIQKITKKNINKVDYITIK